jgi:hypothetical protein
VDSGLVSPPSSPVIAEPAGTADLLAASLAGVGGWLHLDEAEQLHRSVLAHPRASGHLLVVEIGSWKGRSTIALGLAAHARGDVEVMAIDPHLGDNGEFQEESETFTDFLQNIERAGVADVVRPVRSLSHDARPLVEPASVGVLFLDGSHRYEDVVVDLHDWVSALTDGATLACNDSSKPGVYRALRETALRRKAPFREPLLVRSTLFLVHRPGAPWTRGDDLRWIRLAVVLLARRAVHRVVPYLPGWAKRAGNRVSSSALRTR